MMYRQCSPQSVTGVIYMADSATTDCQPNDNVEALRVYMDAAGIEARPVWKPHIKRKKNRSAK